MLVTSGHLNPTVTNVTFAKIDEVAMGETFLLKLSLARAHMTLHFFEHCKCRALKRFDFISVSWRITLVNKCPIHLL